MKKTTLIFAAIAITILAVPFAYAQMHGHRGPGGPEFGGPMLFGHLGHLKDALALTDQQVTDVKAIFQSLHDQNAQYRETLHGNMQQIINTLIANPNDLGAAQALLNQQTAAENAMKSNALTAASKALNVLTPDQRAKLATIVKEHQAEMQSFHRGAPRGER